MSPALGLEVCAAAMRPTSAACLVAEGLVVGCRVL